MIGKSYRLGSLEEPIYTLAQNGTEKKGIGKKTKAPVMVKGMGTELQNNEDALKGRAKKKTITQKLALSLINVCDQKGNPDRKQYYWNTYHCQNKIYLSDERLYGNYCKNRVCSLCSAIRKAEIINKYMPMVKQWEEPYFLTLTTKAVPAKQLNHKVKRTLQALNKIIAKHKKRHQRGKGIKVMGIRCLECNFNPISRTYNPHLHLIVPTKEIAELLLREWLNLWTSKYTYKGAQKMRKVDDIERDMIETIKYSAKIFSDPTMSKKKEPKVTPYVYVSALDNILFAMKSHRIFERFGFSMPKKEPKPNTSKTIKQYKELKFDIMLSDWIDDESEMLLTGYALPKELQAILDSNMNIDLQ